jgi:hypothetical protein
LADKAGKSFSAYLSAHDYLLQTGRAAELQANQLNFRQNGSLQGPQATGHGCDGFQR